MYLCKLRYVFVVFVDRLYLLIVGIDWCGRGLVTPLAPSSSALQETARLLPITDAVQCIAPYNCRYQSPGNFPAGGR